MNKKTLYKKDYINANDVQINDVLLDIDNPFPIGDLRMTVIEEPIVEFEQMFKFIYPNVPYSGDYLNKETRFIIAEVNTVYDGDEIIVNDTLYHYEMIDGNCKFPAHYYGLDSKLQYIDSLECIIKVKPFDSSMYEVDGEGMYFRAFKNYKGELYFKKPICRILTMNQSINNNQRCIKNQ